MYRILTSTLYAWSLILQVVTCFGLIIHHFVSQPSVYDAYSSLWACFLQLALSALAASDFFFGFSRTPRRRRIVTVVHLAGTILLSNIVAILFALTYRAFQTSCVAGLYTSVYGCSVLTGSTVRMIVLWAMQGVVMWTSVDEAMLYVGANSGGGMGSSEADDDGGYGIERRETYSKVAPMP
ncbi:hypothetical protein BC831DRAFT_446501 [Entophlyctis helioformis]|nr:hypothetical protein BC831DRAFT_446501 [Entophlyctis helioformis]